LISLLNPNPASPFSTTSLAGFIPTSQNNSIMATDETYYSRLNSLPYTDAERSLSSFAIP
jgi:hypothetical protein